MPLSHGASDDALGAYRERPALIKQLLELSGRTCVGLDAVSLGGDILRQHRDATRPVRRGRHARTTASCHPGLGDGATSADERVAHARREEVVGTPACACRADGSRSR